MRNASTSPRWRHRDAKESTRRGNSLSGLPDPMRLLQKTTARDGEPRHTPCAFWLSTLAVDPPQSIVAGGLTFPLPRYACSWAWSPGVANR